MKALVHSLDTLTKKHFVIDIPDVASIRFCCVDENSTFGGIGVYISDGCFTYVFDSDYILFISFED